MGRGSQIVLKTCKSNKAYNSKIIQEKADAEKVVLFGAEIIKPVRTKHKHSNKKTTLRNRMPNTQTNTSDNFEPLPPETELFIWHLANLSGRLKEHDRHYTIMELYDDLPTRAYLMMAVLDELSSKHNNQFQTNCSK